jgi:hypothetical protein
VSELVLRHLDAIGASMALLNAQLSALRHAVGEPVKGARLSIPERCNGVEKNQCAEQDGEWLSKSTLADPGAEKCRGCGFLKSSHG